MVTPLILPGGTRETLERRIVVFYTGFTRSASGILKQRSEAVASDRAKQETLKRMVALTYDLRDELQQGRLDSFGDILDENWHLKKSLAAGVTTSGIEDWYANARGAGPSGARSSAQAPAAS